MPSMARRSKPFKTELFHWHETPGGRPGIIGTLREWKLITPSGKTAATVWSNGVWHTWDREGTGGENSEERSVPEAKRQAFAAVAVQGFHEIVIQDAD